MDTSEYTGNPSNHPSSSSAPANKIHETQVQRCVLSSVGFGGVTGHGSVILVQESALPSTPRAVVVSQPSSPSRTATSSLAACLTREKSYELSVRREEEEYGLLSCAGEKKNAGVPVYEVHKQT